LTVLSAREDSLNVLLSATADVVDDFAHELMLSRHEVAQLRGAMQARAPIEQARGMLMMRYGLPADKALHLLLRWSITQGVELRVLAVALVKLGTKEGHRNGYPRNPAPVGPTRADALTAGSSHTMDT
jgi:hypothetical protein